ncbi:MAG: toxic anion resistance protein [Nitrospinota bacterium]|nr:toxic anion resistance protein [Nitrospinota bacterium]MDH5677760.1 toxic anion resistance protein [Nitrospinota bacterium]
MKSKEELQSLDVEQVKQEILPSMGVAPQKKVDPALDKLASEFVEAVMNTSEEDLEGRNEKKAALERLGAKAQTDSAHRSAMLRRPIKELSLKGADGGPVAKALVDLAVEMGKLDPNSWDFSVSGVAKLLSFIPGVGDKMQRYFLQYESAQAVIDNIIKSLEKGRDMLERDSMTLTEDQKQIRALTILLQKQIQVGMLIDQKLGYKLERELRQNDPKYQFIAEELIYPLRQRIMDLQQQLAVNQQGVLAMEIIIRNNGELVRGVSRAINVTASALDVAVTVALALAHQKLVLDRVEILNKSTSDLIAGTARRLRTQGTAIHKQASSAMLDMEALKSAFNDMNEAINELSRFRQEALPKMAQAVLEMDQLTQEGEKAIDRLEKGTVASEHMKGKNWTEFLDVK